MPRSRLSSAAPSTEETTTDHRRPNQRNGGPWNRLRFFPGESLARGAGLSGSWRWVWGGGGRGGRRRATVSDHKALENLGRLMPCCAEGKPESGGRRGPHTCHQGAEIIAFKRRSLQPDQGFYHTWSHCRHMCRNGLPSITSRDNATACPRGTSFVPGGLAGAGWAGPGCEGPGETPASWGKVAI